MWYAADVVAWLGGAAFGFLVGTSLLFALFVTGSRLWTPGRGWGVGAASIAPIALPCYVAMLIAALVLRRRAKIVAVPLLIAGMIGTPLHVAWVLPSFIGHDAGGSITTRVMEANLRYGGADAAQIARIARAEDIDVVVLTELTPEELARLDAVGFTGRYPYHAGRARAVRDGTMAFSRYPLRDVRTVDVSRHGVVAEVESPRPFTLVAAHAGQPFFEGYGWRDDISALQKAVAGLHGPRILVGDLNASMDTQQLRSLAHAGRLRDAAWSAGSGWQPTWPGAIGPWLLRMAGGAAAVDHVLVSSDFAAVSTSTYVVRGTDHRALVARLADR